MSDEKRSAAARLVDLAMVEFEVFVDGQGEPFGRRVDGPNIAMGFRAGRFGLRAALAARYRELHGSPPAQSALADALIVLEGVAAQADPYEVALRYAMLSEGEIVVDLGDTFGTAAIIDRAGWGIVDTSPVLFRRSALTGPMPVPEREGGLDELHALLNVGDSTWPLLVAWMVAAMFPAIPHPVVALFGEQGTAKSTTARLISLTLDPGPAPLRTAPRDVEQWAVAAAGSWVVAIDNVSSIPEWFSDTLCRAVTGDAVLRRQLYTDGGISVLAFRRAVMLTAIDAGALRGDLVDRLLRVELDRIDPRHRLTDTDIMNRFVEAQPRILGGLFDLASLVLRELPDVDLVEAPRMADFAEIVEAVDRVLGTEALACYAGQAAELAAEIVDADLVAGAVRELAEHRGEWEGTAADLNDEIMPKNDKGDRVRGWPQTPRALSGALSRCAPALRTVGVEIERVRTGARRTIRITTEKAGARPSFASSLPDQDVRGDANRDGDANPLTLDRLRHHEIPGHDGSDANDGTGRAFSVVDAPRSLRSQRGGVS